MADKNKKEEILEDIRQGRYVDREDVKEEARKEKMERSSNGGWSK
jgi:hypothetical protein